MKKIKIFIVQLLCSVITILFILIGCKRSTTFKTKFYDKVYNNNISFGYINILYNKYLGPILPFKLNIGTAPIFNEKLKYSGSNMYLDGVSLDVDTNYLVPSLKNGLVVFVGEKEGYGNTIIVESDDATEIWYGNLTNISVKLYDYIDKGSYLGNTIDNKLYLVFKKNGNNLNYEEYIN